MKGDFTRFTHDPRKGYTRVLKQQGRVDLDADWNEAMEIVTHLDRVRTVDVIGRCGVPNDGGGFQVEPDGDGVLGYSPGRIYVDGILVDRPGEDPIPLTEQPDLPGYVVPGGDGVYIAYVDVWERHITALEDPEILEPALGGPDTTTRVRTVAQVRLARIGDDAPLDGQECEVFPGTPTTGTLVARSAEEEDAGNPCIVPAGAGYRGLENRLYRVEIHDDGRDATGAVVRPVTFKWSRDNGSVVLPVAAGGISGDTVTLQRMGPDEVLTVRVGDIVEVLGDETELNGRPGTLSAISADGIDRARLEITLDEDVSAHSGEAHPKMRRWDHHATDALALVDGALPLPDDAFELEDGVIIEFDPDGEYNVGDYWLIPARTRTGDVLWPREGTPPEPVALLPRGITHHYCTLALLRRSGGAWVDTRDCRPLFPPLTEVDGGGCCVTVEPGEDIQQSVDQVVAAGGGCISLCAGIHTAPGGIRIRNTANLVIQGTGPATVVRFSGLGNDGHGGFILEGSHRITLREMALVTASVPALVTVLHGADMVPSRGITVRNVTLVNLTDEPEPGTPFPCGIRVGHADGVTIDRCRIVGGIGLMSLWGNTLSPVAGGGDGDGGDPQVPAAGVVTFDDLAPGTEIRQGTQAVSSGIRMRGTPFTFSNGQQSPNGFAAVQAAVSSGGSGRELELNNLLVTFDFPAAYQDVRLQFGELGGNVNLRVNGQFRNVGGFQQLSGQVIGGVRVQVQPGSNAERGRLVLTQDTAPISDFAIGGQELFIDNVAYRGPVDGEEPVPELVPAGDGVHNLVLQDTGIRFGRVGVLAARAEGWQVRGTDVAPLPRIRVGRPVDGEQPGGVTPRDPDGSPTGPGGTGGLGTSGPREINTIDRSGLRSPGGTLTLARTGFSTTTPEPGADEMERAAQAILDFSGEDAEGDARATAAALGSAVDVLFAAPPRITRGIALLAYLWRNCTIQDSRLRGGRGVQGWWWMGGGLSDSLLESREATVHTFWLHGADWSRNRVQSDNGAGLSFAGAHRSRLDGNRIRGMVGVATVTGTAAAEGLTEIAEVLQFAYGLTGDEGDAAVMRLIVEDAVELLGLEPLAAALDVVLADLADQFPQAAGISATSVVGNALLGLLRREGVSLPLPLIDLHVVRNDIDCRHACVQLEGFLPLGPIRIGHNRLHTTTGQAVRIEVARFLVNANLVVFLLRILLDRLVESLDESVANGGGEAADEIPGLLGVLQAMARLVRGWRDGAEGFFELDTRVEANTIRSLRTAVETNLFEATIRDNHITLQERPRAVRTPTTGRIFGTVRSVQGELVPGAIVRIDGSALATTTDARGSYQFVGLPAGSYTLRAAAAGFNAASSTVTLTAGQQLEVDLTLPFAFSNNGFRAGAATADAVLVSRASMAAVANDEIRDVILALQGNAALAPLAEGLREGAHTNPEAFSAWLLGTAGPLGTAAARTAAAGAITAVAGATSDAELREVSISLNTALRNNDGPALATLLPAFIRILFGYVDTQGILARGAGCRIVDNHVVVPEDGRPESRSLGGIQVSVAYADVFILIVVTQLLLQALSRDDNEEPLRVDPLLGVTETLVDNNEVIGGEGHGISVQGVAGAPDLLFDLHVRGNQVRGMGGTGILCNEHAWVIGAEVAGNQVAGCGRSGGFSRVLGGIVLRTTAVASLLGNQVARCGQGEGNEEVVGIELDTIYGLRMNDNRVTANGSERGAAEDGGVLLREVYGEAQVHDNQVTFNRGTGLQWTNSARGDEPPLFPSELAGLLNLYLRAPQKGTDLRADERVSMQGNVFQSETAGLPLAKLLNLNEVHFSGNSLHAGAGSAPLAELEQITRGIVANNMLQTGAAIAIRIQKMTQGVATGNVGNRPVDIPASGVQHGFNIPPAV